MKKVRVFKHKTCVYCPQLIKWLTSKEVKFEIIDRDEHPIIFKRMIHKTGYMTVPVTQIEDEYIVGMNLGKMIPTLKKYGLIKE